MIWDLLNKVVSPETYKSKDGELNFGLIALMGLIAYIIYYHFLQGYFNQASYYLSSLTKPKPIYKKRPIRRRYYS